MSTYKINTKNLYNIMFIFFLLFIININNISSITLNLKKSELFTDLKTYVETHSESDLETSLFAKIITEADNNKEILCKDKEQEVKILLKGIKKHKGEWNFASKDKLDDSLLYLSNTNNKITEHEKYTKSSDSLNNSEEKTMNFGVTVVSKKTKHSNKTSSEKLKGKKVSTKEINHEEKEIKQALKNKVAKATKSSSTPPTTKSTPPAVSSKAKKSSTPPPAKSSKPTEKKDAKPATKLLQEDIEDDDDEEDELLEENNESENKNESKSDEKSSTNTNDFDKTQEMTVQVFKFQCVNLTTAKTLEFDYIENLKKIKKFSVTLTNEVKKKK